MSNSISTVFDLPGRFYRGNLHTHTTMSDGTLSPAELADAYRSEGYHFVVASDHFWERHGWPITDTRDVRTPDFTTLIGAELHAPQTKFWEVWHLLAVGLPLDFAPPDKNETGPELARRAAATGAFIGLAHPAWYALTVEDADTIDVAHAVEVYNHTSEVGFGKGDSWSLMDILLARGRKLTAFAADDAHFRTPDAFGGWVQVKARTLCPDALLAALKAGHYYSSQGPEIHHIDVGLDSIVVSCSPAWNIIASWQGKFASRSIGYGQTEAKLDRRALGDADYFIVTVVDESGRKAWSNPIWLKGRS
ncbi:CehA/McbA family metallohydrolase [Aquamicrobium sp. LC103]|uniref:CehA/McbA family metallohydrolase n=1 Tax=Aquamicrobium sp. LC103 TaxID=1120658 RepID=UPI00063EA285|nr:CehA/McbA family metallohydrolase [Aquamicrobium sp. LC103]TKT82427.1 phosphotransferase [Aquamicrobium sp. LC103]